MVLSSVIVKSTWMIIVRSTILMGIIELILHSHSISKPITIMTILEPVMQTV